MNRRFNALVTSNKADKTVVVKVVESKSHPIYRKQYKISRKFQVHDEKNEASVGDVIEVEETRPMSKNKHLKLTKIISKAEG